MNRTQYQGAKWQSTLGLTGLLAWMFMFGVVEYAHDALMAKRGGHDFWATVYEVSAGYILGFVTALAVWMLAKLTRGTAPEVLSDAPWMRALSATGLAAVVASALAGLVMHNLGGLTLTYDASFLLAILVVSFGVIPLYRRWRG